MYNKIVELPNTHIVARIDSCDGKIFHAAMDISRWNGILHFSHEINIVFSYNKNGTLHFRGGSEIASSVIRYTEDEEGMKFFESMHPGILDDIVSVREKIVKKIVIYRFTSELGK